MILPGVLTDVVRALEMAQIPYMLTGSLATSYHGTPRATQDIDLVIHPSSEQLRRFVAALPKERFYVDEETAMGALASESQFNVVDLESGWKVDFIVRRSRPFSRMEFDRRQTVQLGETTLVVATAEDVLLAKLEWAKLGQSERQVDDVAGVLRVRGDELDFGYLERWVEDLGVTAEWEHARRKAGMGSS